MTLQLSAAAVAQGTVTVATASVTNAGTPARVGVVDFYDGGRMVGSMQVVGTASAWGTVGSVAFRKIFAPGSHALQATFRGTLLLPAASSATSMLQVAGSRAVDEGLHYAGTTELSNHGLWDLVADFNLADVNLDGKPDLVAIQFDESEVAIAPGNPNVPGIPSDPGTFVTPPAFVHAQGNEGERVLTADLNGDGLLDLMVLLVDAGKIFVYIATAPGVYGAPHALDALAFGAQYPQMVEADFNGDGLPDIVAVTDSTVTPGGLVVWLNDAAHPGSFLAGQATTIPNISSAGWLQSADLNGDGLPDIVVSPANFSSTALTVLMNDKASPGLQWKAKTYDLGVATWRTTLADINGDGLPDLIAGTFGGSVLVALNDAGHPGSLLAPRNFPAPASMQTSFLAGVAAGDIDGDGLVDVVAADYANHFVVFRGDGGGNLVPGTAITVAPTPLLYGDPMFAWSNTAIAIADVDGDGLGDVLLTELRQNSVQVYRHVASPGALIQTATDVSIPLRVYPQGQPIPITATETSRAGTMSGAVEFFDTGGGAFFSSIGTAPIVAGKAVFTVLNAAVGFHDYTAFFHSDSTFAASESAIFPVVVLAAASASVKLTGSPNPAAVAQPATFRVTVTAATGTGTPTGSVSFYDGATLLGSAAIVSGGASLNVTTLGAGSHSIAAVYTGDASFPTSTSNTLIEVIEGPATTTLSVTPTVATVNSSIQFVATVTATTPGSPAPTGSVSFRSGTSLLGSANLNAGGVASMTNATLPVGIYSVLAQYSGDANFPANTSNIVSLTITAAVSSTALSVTPNPAYAGQAVTMAATVTLQTTSTQGAGGSVTFFDGSTLLGTQAVTTSGSPNSTTTFTASITTAGLAVGTHPISATFNPSSTGMVASTSPVVNVVILTSGFTIALLPTTITLAPGASGTVGIQLASTGNFAGPLALTYGTLPAYATASINPTTVTLTAGGTGSSVLTLNTLLKASNKMPAKPGSGGPAIFTALMLLLVPFSFSRRGRRGRLLGLAVLAVGLQAVTGCTNAWYTVNTVASGSYQLAVIATDVQHRSETATLTVVVTP